MNRHNLYYPKALSVGCFLLLGLLHLPRINADEEASLFTPPPALHAEMETNEEWAMIDAQMRSQSVGLVQKQTEDYLIWRDYTLRMISDLGWAFFDKHPDDSRRWVWAEFMTNGQNIPGFSNSGHSHWNNRVYQLKEICIASPSAPAVLRSKLRCGAVDLALMESHSDGPRGAQVDWLKFGKEVIAIANDAPADEEVQMLLKNIADAVLRGAEKNLGANNAVQIGFAASPSPVLIQLAARNDAILSARTTPMTMKFIALDGREVDLSRMRRKVVLIDFRGVTWCGSCREEEPFIRAAYDKYHDQGFEVICITWEMKESTRDFVVKYIAGRGMPWPHYFDGKWKNPFIEQFGITSVPTQFLLDKNGLLVSTEAHGKQLDPLVRQYLGLPSMADTAGKQGGG